MEKANANSDCLQNQFTHHDMCDENHERPVETRVRAGLETVENNYPERIGPFSLTEIY
jgi:hypothetical protein